MLQNSRNYKFHSTNCQMASFPQAHNNTLLYNSEKVMVSNSVALLFSFFYTWVPIQILIDFFCSNTYIWKFILHLDKSAPKIIYSKIYKFIYKTVLFIIFKAMDK